MGKLSWYINRLRAMNIAEVWWRVEQKMLQRQEMRTKYSPFPDYGDAPEPFFDGGNLAIERDRDGKTHCTTIHLLGGFDYEMCKRAWHAGFQTVNEWPRVCSYKLDYKGRDDIGDARTNWELNRHFQFALFVKAYYVTGDGRYYDEFRYLLNDWVKSNPFLVGISWTSVMEVAIRLINWTIARAFLSWRLLPEGGNDIVKTLDSGILGMAGYVARHYSRYSSANNHLLVEATALAYAGFAYNHKPWQDLAIRLLDEQLELQNCSDGVNREMSLHYQTFGMEAYALTMHLMRVNSRPVPIRWIEMMKKQCEFVSHSMVTPNVACEFGDNDEGKIIDLQGGEINHYRYVLQLCSLITGTRYDPFDDVNETIKWLFDPKAIKAISEQPLYDNSASRTFVEGGYTFLRNGDIFVGIDHAPLGFGSIAAHGHADALSFQLYKDGKPIFIDPGTFIYHCNAEKRNAFRRSINHNTATINGMEQSEMLGAFLWGKKAKTMIDKSSPSRPAISITALTDGMSGVTHYRNLGVFLGKFSIIEGFSKVCDWVDTFMLAPNIEVKVEGKKAESDVFTLETTAGEITIEDAEYSPAYGIIVPTRALRIRDHGGATMITIKIK